MIRTVDINTVPVRLTQTGTVISKIADALSKVGKDKALAIEVTVNDDGHIVIDGVKLNR